MEASAEPPKRWPWELEIPGSLGPEQRKKEQMESDEAWTPGCWIASYLRMHHKFIEQAKAINAESQRGVQERRARAGQDDVDIHGGLKYLREQVFTLCPMPFLYSGIFFSSLMTVLTFLVPHFQGRLVDACIGALAKYQRGEEVDEFELLRSTLAIVGLLMFGGYFCEIIVGIMFAVAGHTTVTRLRIKMFRNLTVQEVAFYDSHQSGELSSRLINDSARLSSLVQFTTQTLLGAIVRFSGSLVAMYSTHWKLALLATFLTPFNTMLVKRTGRIAGYYGTVQNAAMAKANALAVEVLGNIRTVQANVGEAQEAHLFMERLNYFLRVVKGTIYFQTGLKFTSYGLNKSRDLVVLAVAMHQIIHGSLTIGQWTAFNSYIGLYEAGFNNLASIWINFTQTITSTGKFVQLLLRTPGISPDRGGLSPPKCFGKVEFRDVCFAYKSNLDMQILTKVNITANPGDVVALVGESGAGKSTIGRLLQRFYDPCAGQILLDDRDIKTLSVWWLRAHLGVVEQEPVLFDRSLRENISYGSASGKSLEEIEAAAKLAKADFINDLSNKYETRPGERAARISSGQKQRIAIARAIIRNPQVFLLDEATSALDSENEKWVQMALDHITQERKATTFVIAHRLSTVRAARKIVVIQKGSFRAEDKSGKGANFSTRESILEQGTDDELMKANGRYAQFMEHQRDPVSQSKCEHCGKTPGQDLLA